MADQGSSEGGGLGGVGQSGRCSATTERRGIGGLVRTSRTVLVRTRTNGPLTQTGPEWENLLKAGSGTKLTSKGALCPRCPPLVASIGGEAVPAGCFCFRPWDLFIFPSPLGSPLRFHERRGGHFSATPHPKPKPFTPVPHLSARAAQINPVKHQPPASASSRTTPAAPRTANTSGSES